MLVRAYMCVWARTRVCVLYIFVVFAYLPVISSSASACLLSVLSVCQIENCTSPRTHTRTPYQQAIHTRTLPLVNYCNVCVCVWVRVMWRQLAPAGCHDRVGVTVCDWNLPHGRTGAKGKWNALVIWCHLILSERQRRRGPEHPTGVFYLLYPKYSVSTEQFW